MNLQDFQQKLFDAALNDGFSETEVYFENKEVFGCRIYKGEIDQYEIAEDGGVSFRGLYNGKMGYAYSEKIDSESIPFLVASAKENACIIEDESVEDIFSGSDHYEQGDFFSNELNEVTIQEKIQLIKDVEKEVLNYDPRISGTDYCLIKTVNSTRALSNSKGVSLKDRSNYLFLIVEAIAKDGEETKTGFKYIVTKDFSSLNAKEIAKQAAEEALSFLGSKSIENKDYPVLLRNDAAANLLATFSSVFSAENSQSGRSLLHDKLGTKIADGKVTITDNPLLKDGVASRTFDGEGVASRITKLVHEGVLQSFLHNQKTANKDQTLTTGNAHKESYKSAVTVGPSNLYIEPASVSYEELIASMDEGVIITELSGLHSGANQISGDFSVAANGYYVKNGKIETPVNLMTIAGNFFELLNQVEGIGSDLIFPLSNIGSPSLKIKSLAVTVE
ncbi:TldD/PmbA family protein [Heyndrickxia sp. NPDC080065]|uniref:TldD/PmbA family protein n=1 Tax=Heyndrickxia sp. NPDC080065 TaxID=3390568 RepID=UPI003D03F170